MVALRQDGWFHAIRSVEQDISPEPMLCTKALYIAFPENPRRGRTEVLLRIGSAEPWKLRGRSTMLEILHNRPLNHTYVQAPILAYMHGYAST